MEKIAYKVEALVEEHFFFHDSERKWVDVSGFVDSKEYGEKLLEDVKRDNKEWENNQDFDVIRYELATYKVTNNQYENVTETIYTRIS